MAFVYGRNPVWEALQGEGAVQKIYVQHGATHGKIRQIYRLARQQKIPITNADVKKLQQMVGPVNHQGVVALISQVAVRGFHELPLDNRPERPPRCVVIADRIQDPHNMGAIIRSAEIFGAEGVIFGTRENVPLTEVVIKASAGAALHCPLYRADNLSQAVDALKQGGFWVYGADVAAKTTLWQLDFRRHCAIIIGSEEKGIRPGLLKACDQTFRIPQTGKTQSLNASVAAGIVLAEMVRQRALPSGQ